MAATAPATPRRRPSRVATVVKKTPRSIVWLLVAVNIAVLIFMVLASFKTSSEIFDRPWSLPEEWNLDNWREAWVNSGFGRAAGNTVAVVAASSLSTIALAAPAAYVLARSNTRLAGRMTVAFALAIGVPSQVIVIPVFVMLAEVGLVNSLPGLYLVYTALGLPFSVFLLTGFFRSLPTELEEAATLDGAGALRMFFRIMLPLARSGIVTALTLNILSMWNETLMALVLLQDTANYTLSVALLAFLSTVQYGSGSHGALLVGACIVVLPTLLIYIWLGRRLIEGISIGSGK